MRSLYGFLIAAALMVLIPTSSWTAPPPIIQEGAEYRELGAYLDFLEDPGRALTIADVSAPDASRRFTPSGALVSNFGFTNSAWWARFTVKHAAAREVVAELTVGEDWMGLVIRDDGIGVSEAASKGRGLVHMASRAQELGGSFTISAVGGTELRVMIPTPVKYPEQGIGYEHLG
jgi:7TMR-DISM extracellular protein 2